jgi:hypothetical protein
MPSYWPDKPHPPIYRPPLNRFVYWCFHRRFALRSRFLMRWWSERETFRILRTIARQRMRGFVVNPAGGNPLWVIDAPANTQENRYPLNTCLLRGWIEEIKQGSESYKGFPVAVPLLAPDQTVDDLEHPPYYRLTTAGWNALKHQYEVSRIALAIAALALSVSLLNAFNAWSRTMETPSLKITFPAPSPPR